MMAIADNVKRIEEMICDAALKAGRSREEITFVAASKMNDTAAVREAYDAGVRFFGENRVQEMLKKNDLGAYNGAELHFIGHLQSNKVKNVVGTAALIQSAGSAEIVKRINAKAEELGICQRILLEINIGGEENKSGIAPEAADEIAASLGNMKGISLEGFMTIPPVTDKIAETCRYFERMYKLFIDIKAKKYDNNNMYALSMGMSSDFPEAIKAGATIVRIGTAVFGERNYN